MKAAIFAILAALLLTGCTDGFYRYPCQDPMNKDNPECNRPICEETGYCYDTLNGLPTQQAEPESHPDTAIKTDCEPKGE